MFLVLNEISSMHSSLLRGGGHAHCCMKSAIPKFKKHHIGVTHVSAGVKNTFFTDVHVNTNFRHMCSLLYISRMAGPIVTQFGVHLGAEYLLLLHESWVRNICMCPGQTALKSYCVAVRNPVAYAF